MKGGKKVEPEPADASGIINMKTKKLMDQMNQDNQEYGEEKKIVVEKLHKTITKESKIGGIFNRFNMKKKRYVDQIAELKTKNVALKKFDEMEAMINSYEKILFHQHLFTDNEESHLTKLDMYYANQHYIYNEGLISTNLQSTIFIQYICEHLTVAPLALFLDRMITIDGF